MAKILLINPPVWPFTGIQLNFNPGLGLPSIGAVLKKNGHEVSILDCEAMRFDLDKTVNIIKNSKPDILGITATTVGFQSMIRISRLTKTQTGTKVIIGGCHVTARPEQSLKLTGADVAVAGEGESVIEEAIEKPYGVITNNRPENVASLQWPARELLVPSINSGKYIGNQPTYRQLETSVSWSRGCPHGCSFCSHPVFGNRIMKFRHPADIVAELKHLHVDYGIMSFFVYDDESVGLSPNQHEWLEEVLDRLEAENLDIDLKTQGRCSEKLITLDLAKKMRKVGFRSIMLGCESGSDTVLKANNKGTTPDDMRHTIKIFHDAGIDTWTFWMVGNLEETPEECAKTQALIKELKPYIRFKQVTICTPWAGSKMHDLAVKGNWIFGTDATQWLANKPQMKTPWMTPAEMIEWRDKLLQV